MTEKEYIYVRDLSNSLTVLRCLNDMNPDHSVMSSRELDLVQKTVQKWRDDLFNKCEAS